MNQNALLVAVVVVVSLAGSAVAEDPVFTKNLGREDCSFTSSGTNPYMPLTPGMQSTLEGEVDDDGELIDARVVISVLAETMVVDGVLTRVVEEREYEDDELVEVSRNYVAYCRETGAIWYFGEDVDDYEDGEIVSHGGAWRTGVDGAQAGILMPGAPLVGARYYQEIAPGVAEDRGEIIAFEDDAEVPAGTFEDVLVVMDTNALDPESADTKRYARGIGLIQDEDLELVEMSAPACVPDEHALCLADGRFRVEVEWSSPGGEPEDAHATEVSDDSGEFWFFNPGNVELIVKVLDACSLEGFGNFWVFSSGLTDRGVEISVTDTETGAEKEYESAALAPFAPILDTAAFQTCP